MSDLIERLHDDLDNAEDRIAELEARLELYAADGTRLPESCDGIACRDETIKLQDNRIAKLEAENVWLMGKQMSDLAVSYTHLTLPTITE